MSSLPEEIYHDILLRSPVRSLLAFKCVCKNWYALISTSDFVKTHVTIQKNNPRLMLEGSNSNGLCSIGCGSLESLCKIKEDVVEMDYPFKSLDYGARLLGSSNGLICLRLYVSPSDCGCDSDCDCDLDSDNDRNFLYLWNPATGEYKEIPKLPNRFGKMCAFGYDHKTDDYKFIMTVEETNYSNAVKVYTLASNSWKTGESIPLYFVTNRQNSGVLVNGDLHWVVMAHCGPLLISLDIGEDTFKEMQLPKELLEEEINVDRLRWTLGVLDGCLCVLNRLSYANGAPINLNVWKMLDYGVQDSWTKCYVISQENIINKIINTQYYYFRLVMSFENGEILFLNNSGLVLYDPKYGSTRELKINNLQFCDAEKYFESLVSLKSGTYVGGEKMTEESTET